VEADRVVSATATQSSAPWGLDRIDQSSLPLSGSYSYTPTGAGVKAYIIDTGIRFGHGQFAGRAVSGYDAIDGGSADDCNGHGTHGAGSVGAGPGWVLRRPGYLAGRTVPEVSLALVDEARGRPNVCMWPLYGNRDGGDWRSCSPRYSASVRARISWRVARCAGSCRRRVAACRVRRGCSSTRTASRREPPSPHAAARTGRRIVRC
jgi:subtilisin family serine protease